VRDDQDANLIATWAIGMIGTALDLGISEKMIMRALHPDILPELIKVAQQPAANPNAGQG
jgi:hypothetical protein